MDRAKAWEILNTYVKNQNLVKHSLAVEAAMRGYAEQFGEEVEEWRITGLLHDFDYEIHPTADKHPQAGAPILRDAGVPEHIVYSILSHAEYLNLERKSLMDKTLYAVDELAGFIVAVTLVRPSKSLSDVKVSSVKKKMKDKGFARAVKREDIIGGAESLNISLDDHIGNVIDSMRKVAPALGLG